MRDVARITRVEPRFDYVLHLWFADGTDGDVDIRPLVRGALFKPMIDDIEAFRSVTVDAEMGTIVWPNGADLDPEVLRYGLKPAWMEAEEADLAKKKRAV
jgi:hypothetical protein